jgi:amylosucrase
VLLKAEAIVPTRELPAYFGEGEGQGRECHLAYHSSLMAAGWAALAEQRTDLLCKVIEATPALPAQATWLTYVRCHDDIGWNVLRPEIEASGSNSNERLAAVSRFFSGTQADSFADGAAFQTGDGLSAHGTNGMASALVGFSRARNDIELKLAERRLTLLYGVALCFGGLPLVYMGDEVALGNNDSGVSQAALQLDGRWLQRPLWDEARGAERRAADTAAGRVFASMRRLARQRQRIEALAAHVPRQLLDSGHRAVLALKRGERFMALSNFSQHPAVVDLCALTGSESGQAWFDCLAERHVGNAVELEPWGTAWLEREKSE